MQIPATVFGGVRLIRHPDFISEGPRLRCLQGRRWLSTVPQLGDLPYNGLKNGHICVREIFHDILPLGKLDRSITAKPVILVRY